MREHLAPLHIGLDLLRRSRSGDNNGAQSQSEEHQRAQNDSAEGRNKKSQSAIDLVRAHRNVGRDERDAEKGVTEWKKPTYREPEAEAVGVALAAVEAQLGEGTPAAQRLRAHRGHGARIVLS